MVITNRQWCQNTRIVYKHMHVQWCWRHLFRACHTHHNLYAGAYTRTCMPMPTVQQRPFAMARRLLTWNRTNNTNNATHTVKLGRKRRESSKRNYYIISQAPRVIIKVIIIIIRLPEKFETSKVHFLWRQTKHIEIEVTLVELNIQCTAF